MSLVSEKYKEPVEGTFDNARSTILRDYHKIVVAVMTRT